MLKPTRAVFCAAIAIGVAFAQDVAPVPTHDVEISLTEGTPGMNAVASPNHQWLAFDLLGSIWVIDRKSTRLNSSHANISYAVFCLKKNIHAEAGWPPWMLRGPWHEHTPTPGSD